MRSEGLMRQAGRARLVPLPRALRAASLAVALVCVVLFACTSPRAQTGFKRDVGREMLKDIKRDIRENYYDPTYRGKDLDAHFKAAEDLLSKAETTEQVYAVVAQALMDFDDSHL